MALTPITGSQGSQIVSVKYSDPVNAENVNALGFRVQPIGIYYGGKVTISGTTTATLYPFVAIVADSLGSRMQVKIESTVSVNVTVASGEYLVGSWTYNAVPNDYLVLSSKTVANIAANDIVFCKNSAGTAVYGDFTSFTVYGSNRTIAKPAQFDVYPDPTDTTKVWCNGGWITTSAGPVFISPTSLTVSSAVTHLIYVDIASWTVKAKTYSTYDESYGLALVTGGSGAKDKNDILDLRSSGAGGGIGGGSGYAINIVNTPINSIVPSGGELTINTVTFTPTTSNAVVKAYGRLLINSLAYFKIYQNTTMIDYNVYGIAGVNTYENYCVGAELKGLSIGSAITLTLKIRQYLESSMICSTGTLPHQRVLEAISV